MAETTFSLDDSLQSALDYDAEVAYISMTSPLGVQQPANQDTNDEFDFSINESSPTDCSDTGEKVKETQHAKPPLLSRASSARSVQFTNVSESTTSATPISPPALHYTLDTSPPNTPTSQLRRIKEAQTVTHPSPKSALKLGKTEHLYCTLVVYGSSGCGCTHLVNKLADSNPSIFAKVVASTTRKRRPNELHGVDFHFLSHKQMSLAIEKGHLIEHIRVHRKGRRNSQPLQRKPMVHLQNSKSLTQSPHMGDKHQHMDKVFLKAATQPELIKSGKRCDSLFDLTEEDSPVVGGEIFGTSHQALTQAIQQGKPCVLLNVSNKGAEQLKNAGVEASYVLIYNGPHQTKDKHSELDPDYIISSRSLDHAYSYLQTIAFELVTSLNLPSTSQYQATKYEWDSLPTIEFERSNSFPHKKTAEVTFSEMLTYFHNTDLKKQLARAKSEQTKSSFFSRPKLSKKLQDEKLLVQAIAYYPLNDRDRLHLNTLQTIYSKLTGKNLTCRRFGTHWQEIGFSSVDPADDMQEVGLLGLIQLIYFLDNPQTAHFCKEIFQYCYGSGHVTPFCVLSFKFTQLSLEALDRGILNKLCNKRDQVFAVVNDFYMAAFHHYYQTWKSSQKAILELELLMQQCGDQCKSQPQQTIQEWEKHLSTKEQTNHILPEIENSFTPFDEITSSS